MLVLYAIYLSANSNYFLFNVLVQGFRSDIIRKRKSDIVAEDSISSNTNVSPPRWIRIFKANTPTSRRTQAAAMAYMTPACTHLDNNTAIDLLATTTARRRMKLDMYINHINVPYCFLVMARNFADALNDNLSLVCDGGIDNDVPPLPPQIKVNDSMILLLLCLNLLLRSNTFLAVIYLEK